MGELFTIAFFSLLAIGALVYTVHLIAFGRRNGWDSSFEVTIKLPTLIIRTDRLLSAGAIGLR